MLAPNRPKTTLLQVVMVLALAGAVRAEDKPKVLPADEARNHIGEKATFELVVQLSKNAEPEKIYFLDSEKDYHDEKNLALLISYDDAPAFKKAGIDDPTTYYKDKTIRVTGKVVREGPQVRIHVKEPGQIEVVKKTEKKP